MTNSQSKGFTSILMRFIDMCTRTRGWKV